MIISCFTSFQVRILDFQSWVLSDVREATVQSCCPHYLQMNQVPLVSATSTATELSRRYRHPYFFGVSHNPHGPLRIYFRKLWNILSGATLPSFTKKIAVNEILRCDYAMLCETAAVVRPSSNRLFIESTSTLLRTN